MKSLYNISDLGFGSWQTMCEAYFANPVAQSDETERKFKGLGQCQLELWGLTSRRMQACIGMPSQLARCRTPMDILNVQAQFWEAAFSQGAESTRRIAQALAVAADAPPDAKPVDKVSEKLERDLISLPVGKKSRRSTRAPVKATGEQRRVA